MNKKTLLLSLLSLVAVSAPAKNVSFLWDAEPDANVIAYTVSYWLEGAGEIQNISVGPTERRAPAVLTSGAWNAQVVAVGNTGISSDHSLPANAYIPVAPANLRIVVE